VRALSSVALLMLLPVVVACGSGSTGSQTVSNYYSAGGSANGATHAPAKMNKHGETDASGASSVKVEMGDYYFSPTVIKATPGQKLTFKLSNHGTVAHNFTLAAQRIDRDLAPQQTATVQVTVPSSGLVPFFCKYHKRQGMAGELVARQPSFTG
jgi:plastocyanin